MYTVLVFISLVCTVLGFSLFYSLPPFCCNIDLVLWEEKKSACTAGPPNVEHLKCYQISSKLVLSEWGIDISLFKLHSLREGSVTRVINWDLDLTTALYLLYPDGIKMEISIF